MPESKRPMPRDTLEVSLPEAVERRDARIAACMQLAAGGLISPLVNMVPSRSVEQTRQEGYL